MPSVKHIFDCKIQRVPAAELQAGDYLHGTDRRENDSGLVERISRTEIMTVVRLCGGGHYRFYLHMNYTARVSRAQKKT